MNPRHTSRQASGIRCVLLALTMVVTAWLPIHAQQAGLAVNLAPVDGLDLTPDNIFSFRIESTLPNTVTTQVKGTIRYRNSPLQFSYQFTTTVRPGSNALDISRLHPSWNFSSTAFRELFLNYKKMPQGTYEYCVTLTPTVVSGETRQDGDLSQCLYHQADDVFLINLIDPENGAKIHEYNPVLSWTVNYPFASALTYRLRLAEIKDGQNTVTAITRNNPLYQEGNLRQTSLAYPVYGKQLQAWQPYAWTVDAYYKDILLGGAEPWKFIIVEDSLMVGIPTTSVYVDLRNEVNSAKYYAVGEVLIKYNLLEKQTEQLQLQLFDASGNAIKLNPSTLAVKLGDNRLTVPLSGLKHLKNYRLRVLNSSRQEYNLLFTYVNPDFL